ncbi:hypothetical protein D3C72_2237780 [compost metagenome]
MAVSPSRRTSSLAMRWQKAAKAVSSPWPTSIYQATRCALARYSLPAVIPVVTAHRGAEQPMAAKAFPARIRQPWAVAITRSKVSAGR